MGTGVVSPGYESQDLASRVIDLRPVVALPEPPFLLVNVDDHSALLWGSWPGLGHAENVKPSLTKHLRCNLVSQIVRMGRARVEGKDGDLGNSPIRTASHLAPDTETWMF